MDVVIITIGDELLIGQTIDTNSAWMGRALNSSGFVVVSRISVRDREPEIVDAINIAFNRASIVLVTGGLGPTSDDITKKVLCNYYSSELVLHPESLEFIKEYLRKQNLELREKNYLQAMVPLACIPLVNKKGAAPGMWFNTKGKILVSMPGVPYEMEYLMEYEVIPRLNQLFSVTPVEHRYALTNGVSESYLAEKLTDFEAGLPEFVKMAYLPAQGIVKLRLSIYETDENSSAYLDDKIRELSSYISEYVIENTNETFQEIVHRYLIRQKKTLAVAESCTGGYISHLITGIPGCSAYFKGGVTAYSNTAKIQILGVDDEILEKYGAVSRQVAEQMALGVKNRFNSDFAIATTGIAGPDGATPDKPVGTVCIALATPEGVKSEKFTFGNHRNNNIVRSANTALAMLIRELRITFEY